MTRTILAALLAALSFSTPATAEEFSVVSSRDTFVSLIEGRELTRFGVTLEVTRDGQIIGQAFGTEVTGAWDWNGGYFCRDLFYGDRDLGPNCQQVSLNGSSMRFQSDQGTGDFADFRLR